MSVLKFLKGKPLTKPELVGQNGPQFYDDPDAAMSAASDALNATPQEPSVSVTQPTITGATQNDPNAQPWALPNGSMVGRPAVDPEAPPQLQASGGQLNLTDPNESSLPKYADPSFVERTTDASGNVTHNAPGLTKLGVLAHLLQGGIQGTMDAVGSGALNAERGKSYFGAGVQGAQEVPYLRAARISQQQRAQLENQQLQNQVTAYSQPVDLGNGQVVPLGRAKPIVDIQHTLAQTNAERARAEYWTSAAGQKDQLDLQHLYAQAVQSGDAPGAQRYADAITAIQREPRGAAPNDLAIWREQNPQAPISQYWTDKANAQNASRAKFRDHGDSGDDGLSDSQRGHLASLSTKKNNDLRALQSQYTWNPQSGMFEDAKGGQLTEDEFNQRKQAIQNAFEEGTATIVGHDVPHFDYAAPQAPPPSSASSPMGALRGKVGKKSPSQLGTKNLPRVGDVSPQSHVFSKSAWLRNNPRGDVNAAAAQAANTGYQVTE